MSSRDQWLPSGVPLGSSWQIQIPRSRPGRFWFRRAKSIPLKSDWATESILLKSCSTFYDNYKEKPVLRSPSVNSSNQVLNRLVRTQTWGGWETLLAGRDPLIRWAPLQGLAVVRCLLEGLTRAEGAQMSRVRVLTETWPQYFSPLWIEGQAFSSRGRDWWRRPDGRKACMRRQTKGGRGHARKGLKVNARYPANCQALQTQRLLTKRLRPPSFFFKEGSGQFRKLQKWLSSDKGKTYLVYTLCSTVRRYCVTTWVGEKAIISDGFKFLILVAEPLTKHLKWNTKMGK